MNTVTPFPATADDGAPSEYEPRREGSSLPLARPLRDDPGRLARAMAATDMVELRAEIEAEIRAQIDQERQQSEAIAAEANISAQKTIRARGLLRAMGIQGVVEARKLTGADDQPWTDFEADVAYGAADLFLTACRLGAQTRAQDAGAAVAKASARKLDPAIEAGLAASAAGDKAAPVRSVEEDPTGLSA